MWLCFRRCVIQYQALVVTVEVVSNKDIEEDAGRNVGREQVAIPAQIVEAAKLIFVKWRQQTTSTAKIAEMKLSSVLCDDSALLHRDKNAKITIILSLLCL